MVAVQPSMGVVDTSTPMAQYRDYVCVGQNVVETGDSLVTRITPEAGAVIKLYCRMEVTL
jgi:hypothetical protein